MSLKCFFKSFCQGKHIEAVAQRCSVKKVFLEISQNSQEDTAPESFFNKVVGLRPGGCF